MPYLEEIRPEDATGVLAGEYRAAMRRAGRIWGVVAVQCHSPEALRDGMRLYQTVMFGDSPLSRTQREMLAVVTSAANACEY